MHLSNLSVEGSERRSDSLFDRQNALLFGGSLIRGSLAENGEQSKGTAPLDAAVEQFAQGLEKLTAPAIVTKVAPRESYATSTIPGAVERNEPHQLCTAQSCPIEHPHKEGIFLAGGDVPRAWNEYWGYSDPPDEIWQAWAAVERGRGTDRDVVMVIGFAESHRWLRRDAH